MIRVLVCGGRNFADYTDLCARLDRLHSFRGISKIINGGAPGADTLAARWAIERGVPLATYPADWDKHGRAAGPIRNQQMIDDGKPDAVIAFHGGRGTADMVRKAEKAGIGIVAVLPLRGE